MCSSDLYRDMVLYTEAEKLYTRVFDVRRSVLGIEHPDTQKTINDLIATYEKLNQQEKAAEYKAMLISPTEDK